MMSHTWKWKMKVNQLWIRTQLSLLCSSTASHFQMDDVKLHLSCYLVVKKQMTPVEITWESRAQETSHNEMFLNFVNRNFEQSKLHSFHLTRAQFQILQDFLSKSLKLAQVWKSKLEKVMLIFPKNLTLASQS